jgi:hypothetical protein
MGWIGKIDRARSSGPVMLASDARQAFDMARILALGRGCLGSRRRSIAISAIHRSRAPSPAIRGPRAFPQSWQTLNGWARRRRSLKTASQHGGQQGADMIGGLIPYLFSGEFAPITMALSGAGNQADAAERQGKYGTPRTLALSRMLVFRASSVASSVAMFCQAGASVRGRLSRLGKQLGRHGYSRARGGRPGGDLAQGITARTVARVTGAVGRRQQQARAPTSSKLRRSIPRRM